MGVAVDCARMCVCKLGFAIFYFSKEEFFYQRKTCHGNKFVCAERSVELLFYIYQITGGSSGIGKSLAAEAIRKGAAVITLVARNEVLRAHSVAA